MKNSLVFIIFGISAIIHCQNTFLFNENGLAPDYITLPSEDMSETSLYEKTLEWIEPTGKKADIKIENQVENDFIQVIGIKNNAVNEGKIYYHLKYTVKISFENGQYKFEPLEIHLKQNSKYDMGWRPFDLKNGASFFKKGKVIKKYKSYVTDIPAVLNELTTSLHSYIAKEGKNN